MQGDLPDPFPTQNVELDVIFENASSDLKQSPSSTTGSDTNNGVSEVVPLDVNPQPIIKVLN